MKPSLRIILILLAVASVASGENLPTAPGTYQLQARDYSLPTQTTIGSNVKYIGVPGKTRFLPGNPAGGWSYHLIGNNIEFHGITFASGGGFFIDGSGSFNSGIVWDNCEFRMKPTSGERNQINWSVGLRDSRITNNLFAGAPIFAIYGYNYNGLTITNNEFIDCNAAMHIDALAPGCGNALVEQNFITGAAGMGMEFQSQATTLTFQDNWFEHPRLSTTFAKNNNSMAFSLILARSRDIKVLRNVVIAPERPDGVGCRIGFEVGGDNTLVEDNYVNGINHVLAVNDGDGTASVTVQNNKYLNYREPPSITYPSSNPLRTWRNINNGPAVRLSDVMEDRIARQLKPGRNIRYGTTPPPTTLPVPPDDEISSLKAALAQAQSDLTAAKLSLTSTQTELAAAKGKVVELMARIADLHERTKP